MDGVASIIPGFDLDNDDPLFSTPRKCPSAPRLGACPTPSRVPHVSCHGWPPPDLTLPSSVFSPLWELDKTEMDVCESPKNSRRSSSCSAWSENSDPQEAPHEAHAAVGALQLPPLLTSMEPDNVLDGDMDLDLAAMSPDITMSPMSECSPKAGQRSEALTHSTPKSRQAGLECPQLADMDSLDLENHRNPHKCINVPEMCASGTEAAPARSLPDLRLNTRTV